MPRVPVLGALVLALGVCLAVGFAACTAPGADPGGPRIRTAAGSFDPRVSRGPRIVGVDTEAVGPELPWIVQLDGPVTNAEREALKGAGASLVAYQPDDAFVIRATPAVAAGLRGVDGVRAVVPQSPALRIEPSLLVRGGGALRGPTSTKATRLVVEVPGEDEQVAVAQAIRSMGGRVDQLSKSGNYLVATAPLAAAVELAARSDVEWVQRADRFHFVNDEARWVIQAGTGAANVGLTPIWDQGLTGAGQIIGIADSGIAGSMQNGTFVSSSCFFTDQKGKILQYEVLPNATAGDEIGHGTHTSGSLAGYATNPAESVYDGQAKDAQLYFQDIASSKGLVGLPADLSTGLFPNPYAAGARVHSDSWGATNATYDAYAREVDEFVYAHPDFLVAFANGNNGPAAGTVGSPATAKDLISVGASDNATPSMPDRPDYMGNADSAVYQNRSFSSRGPTSDGRIKPTLTAPGAMVSSADYQQACGVKADAGTSMATPTLVGGATLARQYFLEGFYPSGTKTAGDAITPSAALLKAVLIAGADPMDGPNAGTIPSMSQGFGRVNVGHALYFPGDPAEDRLWIHDDSTGIATGAAPAFTLTTDRTGPLKVALTWTDAPAAAGASPALVDDLDLSVTSPGGAVYKGNVLSGGVSVTGGTADHLNVEEVVYLPSAASGTWTVTVTGDNVPQGPQPFALAAVGEVLVPGQGAPGADPPPPAPPPVQPPKCTDATVTPAKTAVGWVDGNGGYASKNASNAFGDDDVYASAGADLAPNSYGDRYGVIQVPITVPSGKTLAGLTLTVTGQTSEFVTAGSSWTFDAVAMPALSTTTTYANVKAAGVLDTAPKAVPDLQVGRKVVDVLTLTPSAVDGNGLLTIRIHGNGTQGSMMSWDSGYPVGPGTGDTTPGLGIPPVIGVCYLGPPAKLAYTTAPQTVTAGGCSGIVTVQTEDARGYVSPVSSGTAVSLSNASGTMTFYSNSTCSTKVTATTIAAGKSTASFYFEDTTAGSEVVNAQASGLTGRKQTETVRPGPVSKLVFATPAQTVVAGACSGVVTIRTEDVYGNASPALASLSVNLGTGPATMQLFSDAGCTNPTTAATIAVGMATGSFYFMDTSAGSPTVGASTGTLAKITQTETIVAKLALKPIGNQTVNENALLDLTASLASDPGTASPVYAITGLPAGASFGSATGHLTWTPSYTQAGSYPMTISVAESGQSDSTSFTVTVNNVDRPPVLAHVGAQSVAVGSTLTFTVTATDPDGDTVTITDSGAPGASSFNGTTFTWTPTASDVGTVTVTFTASDGQLTDTEQVVITVTQSGGTDGGTVGDGGTSSDGGTVADGGTSSDGGTVADGGTSSDGGTVADGGTSQDGGAGGPDGGNGGGAAGPSAPGCGCSTTSGSPAGLVPVVLGLLGLAVIRRRRWP